MFLLHAVLGDIFNRVVILGEFKLSVITFIIYVFFVTMASLLFKSFTDKLRCFLERTCNLGK